MRIYESQSIEFKRIWRDEYLKTICAFANTNGGVLYIGVDDEGKPIGLENASELLERLPNKIKDKLSIIPSINLEKIDKENVIKIEVHPSDVPISYNGKFYVRSGSTIQELRGVELMRFIIRRQGLSWDSLLSSADINEVDKDTVFKFIKMAKDRLSVSENDSIQKILENLELVKRGKLTNAAVLLFAKNPQKHILNSFVRVGRFKTPTEIIDTTEIRGNLFAQVEETVKAIKKHISVRYVIEDIQRKDVWEYPLSAIREACINALIHRDYIDSGEIQIKIYDDHIWFWNPGKLPEGLSLEILRKEHPSKPRNKLLAMVFYYAGLIERWGTGTTRIISLCKEQGLPEPEFKEEFGGFSVVFWKDIYNEQHLRKMGLNERQIKAVSFAKAHGNITISDFSRIIRDVSEKTLYRDLQDLVKRGILKAEGEKKGRKYTLP